MKKIKELFIIISVILLIIIVVKSMMSPNSCDKVVILEDGTEIECKWVSSYVSGVSNIHKCDDSDYQISTNKIKYVIKK